MPNGCRIAGLVVATIIMLTWGVGVAYLATESLGAGPMWIVALIVVILAIALANSKGNNGGPPTAPA